MSSSQIRIGPVTARYTEALFRLAKRHGILAEVQRDVERLDAEVSAPGAAVVLFDARVPEEQRRQRVETLIAGFQPITRNFVRLLFEKRREQVLETFGDAWRQRELAERGAVQGTVESARPLGSAELTQLSRSLGARIGKDVQLENTVDPELLAGVRVTVDNRMIDATVQGRMDALRRRLMEAPLGAAGS